MSADGRIRIIILGGGFGGLYAAMHLEKTLVRDPDVEIILVNRENFFLFTPMLHEVAASDLDLTHIVNPVRKLLRRVQFFDGDVDAIDLSNRRVVVSHGAEHHAHELEYDHLVIALGSITNFFNLPGLEERAFTMKSLGDAIYLRNSIIARLEEADFECCAAERGRLLANAYLEVPEWPGVWALGACALMPEGNSGKFCPPTAQHALREGKVLAHNLTAAVRGGAKKPFVFSAIGQLAAIGRRTGVANIMGVNFSGFFAWWLWRTIYLSKLPRFEKKLRVALDWTLDLIFSKDLVQFITVRAPTLSRPEEEGRQGHGTRVTSAMSDVAAK